jgi:hypothetical protein
VITLLPLTFAIKVITLRVSGFGFVENKGFMALPRHPYASFF